MKLCIKLLYRAFVVELLYVELLYAELLYVELLYVEPLYVELSYAEPLYVEPSCRASVYRALCRTFVELHVEPL